MTEHTPETVPEDRDERQVTLLRRVLAAAADARRRTHSSAEADTADAALEASALTTVARSVMADEDEDDEPTG